MRPPMGASAPGGLTAEGLLGSLMLALRLTARMCAMCECGSQSARGHYTCSRAQRYHARGIPHIMACTMSA